MTGYDPTNPDKQREPEPQPEPVAAEANKPQFDNELQRSVAEHPRMWGSIFLGVAGGFGKWMVWDVLDAARAHADSVHYSFKGILICGVFMALGLFLMIGGRNAAFLLNPRNKGEKPTPLTYVIAALCVVPGIALYWWVQNELGTLGYK